MVLHEQAEGADRGKVLCKPRSFTPSQGVPPSLQARVRASMQGEQTAKYVVRASRTKTALFTQNTHHAEPTVRQPRRADVQKDVYSASAERRVSKIYMQCGTIAFSAIGLSRSRQEEAARATSLNSDVLNTTGNNAPSSRDLAELWVVPPGLAWPRLYSSSKRIPPMESGWRNVVDVPSAWPRLYSSS